MWSLMIIRNHQILLESCNSLAWTLFRHHFEIENYPSLTRTYQCTTADGNLMSLFVSWQRQLITSNCPASLKILQVKGRTWVSSQLTVIYTLRLFSEPCMSKSKLLHSKLNSTQSSCYETLTAMLNSYFHQEAVSVSKQFPSHHYITSNWTSIK